MPASAVRASIAKEQGFAQDAAPPAGGLSRKTAAPQPPAGRLLILDDDITVAQTLGYMAEGMGFESRLATRVDQFFTALDEWSPTHISVDLIMPDMDGVEVLRLLATRGCEARIIVASCVSGRILDAARRSALEHGLDMAGVLTKPFLPATLRSLLGAKPEQETRCMPRAHGPRPGFDVTEESLRRALARGEFHLVYQPKMECRTGVLAGFEALVRWHHPDAGMIMPDQFILQMERWNLIDGLTIQVLDKALRWLSHNYPVSDLSISVNLSPRTLVDFHLGDLAASLCRGLRLAPSRVIFELTETSTAMDPGAALDLLTRLRVKGFQLAIDDFGTGYSSMVHLVRIPFSEIKVDKSFILAGSGSKEARTITKAIVDLGHSLGLLVTAEGVEDAQTLEYLNTIGCDLAQGYFVGCPMTGDVAAGWAARQTLQGLAGTGQ